MQKSENKRQGVKDTRRDDLLDGMKFSINKDISESRKKKKSRGRKYRRFIL